MVWRYATNIVPLWLAKNAKECKISEAKGTVRLCGTACPKEKIVDPLDKEQCVFYDLKFGSVGRTVSTPIEIIWPIYSETRGGFILKDGSGQIEVPAIRPAYVMTEAAKERNYSESKERPTDVPQWLFEKKWIFPWGRRAIREQIIPSGKEVTVVAEIKDGRAKPLILTDCEFYKVESDLTTELIGGGLLFFLFFGFLMALVLISI